MDTRSLDKVTVEKGSIAASKQTLIQQITAIADVFGDDRGLLKHLLTLNDEEIAGVHKFSQAYEAGAFPIDVIVESTPSEKSIFP